MTTVREDEHNKFSKFDQAVYGEKEREREREREREKEGARERENEREREKLVLSYANSWQKVKLVERD